jgi:DNA-binding LytR/AlgR family response regulator
MKIKCMIIDDEPLAQRVLEKYIASVPSLELISICSNAPEASSYLLQHQVDVMFLDIKMPDLSGVDFLKTLNNPPQVILTTAYSEYALEGYEYAVVDYLLKPISFERFLKAINKIRIPEADNLRISNIPNPENHFIFLKADQTHLKMRYQDIQYIQGYGNYVKIFTQERKILIADTLTRLEKILPQTLFIRIHKSYIVAIHQIEKISENKITIHNTIIPIGRTYKMKVREIIGKYRLPGKG